MNSYTNVLFNDETCVRIDNDNQETDIVACSISVCGGRRFESTSNRFGVGRREELAKALFLSPNDVKLKYLNKNIKVHQHHQKCH